MRELGIASAAFAASLALSGAPAVAGGCISDAACVQHALPQNFFVPPVALQQIETASTPTNVSPREAEPVGRSTPDAAELAGLAELDRGLDDWSYIVPEAARTPPPPDQVTFVATTAPARQTRPVPPVTVRQLSDFLAVEVPASVVKAGVPGLEDPASGFGNRALWFLARR